MGLFNRLVVTLLPAVPRRLVGRVASRYVAGATIDDAIDTVRRLNAIGAMGTAGQQVFRLVRRLREE